MAEAWISALRTNPANREAARSLGQLALTLRNEASNLGCRPVIPLLASIGKVAEELRDGSLTFDAQVGDLLGLSFERVSLAVVALSEQREISSLQVEEVATSISLFAGARADDRKDQACRTLDLLTGAGIWRELEIQNDLIAGIVLETLHAPLKADLKFFRDLSLANEQRLPHARGRGDRLVRLATQMNAEAGLPLVPEQLEAAIYMHDVGMALLPDAVLSKPGRLTEEEWGAMRGHVGPGAGLLARMPAWAEAAQMVEQHHERPDGRGYPSGLSDSDIAPGASLIAILDAFEAMTHRRSDRPERKSVLRAMAEINACETQFSRHWVPVANRVVRRLLVAGD
jgi:hypothetical protein